MQHSDHQHQGDLAALLAEYGHLAAQVPAASAEHARWLNARLAELDALIDHHLAQTARH